MNRTSRFEELDSLRGVAALTVVFFHGLNLTVWSSSTFTYKDLFTQLFLYSPLAILNAGHQAVILFFILSGYVLSLPYLKGPNVSYRFFVVRRICRLYIPYLFAILSGMMLRLQFSRGQISGLWGTPIDWTAIVKHLLFIDMPNQNTFDPVIWSLVQEMRLSLLFPFLLYFVKEWNWRAVLIIGFLFSCIGITMHCLFQNVDFFTNYYDTLHYILMFLVGASLANYRKNLATGFQSFGMGLKALWMVIAFAAYTYCDILSTYVGGSTLFQHYASDWFTTLGAAIWITISLSSRTVSAWLRARPLVFVGKISFSIYLYHILWYLTWISISDNQWPIYQIWVYTLGCSLVSALLAYYFVEKPAIVLGRFLTRSASTKETGISVAKQL